MQFKHVALAASALAIGAVAHPGHNVAAEALERREFLKRSNNLQAQCGEHLAARGISAKAKARREALATSFREKRGLSGEGYKKKRDLEDVLNTDHQSNLTGINFSADPDVLFADNSSCLLMPEAIEGPYYVSGELFRPNMTEEQAGVPIIMDLQLIDYSTCEPLNNQHVEFWHCNSTGVYGGIVADGNGAGAADPDNIDNTWLRGIASSDEDGFVQMASIFPGHYVGRTSHVHILVRSDATAFPNNTIAVGSIEHVGQLYFDQSLISEVEATAPYTTNEQPLTTNADDFLLAMDTDTSDPVFEYVYAGETVEDGFVMWITVGIDPSSNRTTIVEGARLTENGGVANAGALAPNGAPLVAGSDGNATSSVGLSGALRRSAPGLVEMVQAAIGLIFFL